MKALETGSFLHRGTLGEPRWGLVLPGTLRDRKRKALKTEHFSLYGSTVTVTWREGSSNGKSERYVRHFKECFGNGAPLSFQRFCERNLKVRLLYWGL